MPSRPEPANAAKPPFQPDPPIVLGLLGGIAAGKSTVAAAFAARGLAHVDADRIAASVRAEPAVIDAVAREFGAEILGQDGQIDRQALAAVAFDDSAARKRLEAITHPPIRLAIEAAISAAQAANRSVLLDAPLLLEGGLIDRCQTVVFVAASDAQRQRRAARRGWTPDELRRREAAHAPLTKKRDRADFVVDNDGSLDEMRRQVDDLLRRLGAGGDPTP